MERDPSERSVRGTLISVAGAGDIDIDSISQLVNGRKTWIGRWIGR